MAFFKSPSLLTFEWSMQKTPRAPSGDCFLQRTFQILQSTCPQGSYEISGHPGSRMESSSVTGQLCDSASPRCKSSIAYLRPSGPDVTWELPLDF